MTNRKGIGGHQSAAAGSTTWLTPPGIINALGGWREFDLDPCAAPMPRPWATARAMNALEDGDGLALQWDGRVWLNPPYSSAEIAAWLDKLARHGNGTALVFARTETEAFGRHVWQAAHGILFITGRLHFHHADGTRAKANAGAPSVLAAYGVDDMDRLAASDIAGQFVPLRLARGLLVAGLDPTWAEAMATLMRASGGQVTVSEAYRYFASHPKARGNPNWRAKVRQTLQRIGNRVAPATYRAKPEQAAFAFA